MLCNSSKYTHTHSLTIKGGNLYRWYLDRSPQEKPMSSKMALLSGSSKPSTSPILMLATACFDNVGMHSSMYVCMYVCVCVFVYVCLYVCMCVYVCVFVCVCMYVFVCVYMCVCLCVYVCVCMYVCVCIYVCVYIRMHCVVVHVLKVGPLSAHYLH